MQFFLAEDDPLMVRLYERAFQLAGHDLQSAKDGEEALAKLKTMSPKPSVILLDIMMPKLNGYDVLAQIKQDATLKDIPVLVLTNLSGNEDMSKAFSLEALDYLVKSDFSAEQVVAKAAALAEK